MESLAVVDLVEGARQMRRLSIGVQSGPTRSARRRQASAAALRCAPPALAPRRHNLRWSTLRSRSTVRRPLTFKDHFSTDHANVRRRRGVQCTRIPHVACKKGMSGSGPRTDAWAPSTRTLILTQTGPDHLQHGQRTIEHAAEKADFNQSMMTLPMGRFSLSSTNLQVLPGGAGGSGS